MVARHGQAHHTGWMAARVCDVGISSDDLFELGRGEVRCEMASGAVGSGQSVGSQWAAGRCPAVGR